MFRKNAEKTGFWKTKPTTCLVLGSLGTEFGLSADLRFPHCDDESMIPDDKDFSGIETPH
jgi:hypothetical protein